LVLAEREETETIETAFARSVILCVWRDASLPTSECIQQLQEAGWSLRVGTGDALILRVRSRQVSKWYRQHDDDVFLMVDGDIVFALEDAERVVRHARETRSIVCGAYPVRDNSHLACRVPVGKEIVFAPNIQPRPKMDLIEITYPATGFMAVHRDVIQAMVESGELPLCNEDLGIDQALWPFFNTFWLTGEDGESDFLSEDYAFGERARRLGFKTYLDPAAILFHLGEYAYSVHNMPAARTVEVPR